MGTREGRERGREWEARLIAKAETEWERGREKVESHGKEEGPRATRIKKNRWKGRERKSKRESEGRRIMRDRKKRTNIS